MEAKAKPERVTGDIAVLYCELLAKHYGRNLRANVVRSNRKMASALEWVSHYCEDNRIDPALYVTAQMHSMKPFLDRQRAGGGRITLFMPNMLRGDNAVRRFEAFIVNSRRHFKEASTDSFDRETEWGLVLAATRAEEVEVAEDYVSRVVAGETTTWTEVADSMVRHPLWTGLNRAELETTRLLERQFGSGAFLILPLVRLRVANAVASLYDWRYPRLIGVSGPFDWKPFAELMRERHARPVAAPKPAPLRAGGMNYQPTDDHGEDDEDGYDD